MPICYQFWFIRDLMVVVLCSPIVYWLIRNLKTLGIVLLSILWCFGLWFPITGFSSAAFFFFSFGAWFAIHNRNFTIDFKPLRWAFTCLYILLMGAYHGMSIALFVKFWVKLMQPITEVTMVLGYILIPFFIVGLGIGIYAIMLKYLPRFTGFITGGR